MAAGVGGDLAAEATCRMRGRSVRVSVCSVASYRALLSAARSDKNISVFNQSSLGLTGPEQKKPQNS